MNVLTPVHPAAPTRRKLDIDAFYRLAEIGIIDPHHRIELIDGDLIDMAPIGNDHADAVDVLTRLLVLACLDQATVSVQNPLRANRFDQPQPDIAVYRGGPPSLRNPTARTPENTLLVIEIADSSARYDRTTKLALYARAGVPEYWIMDIPNRTLLVHRRPSGATYLDLQRIAAPTRIALAAAPDITLDLGQLLG